MYTRRRYISGVPAPAGQSSLAAGGRRSSLIAVIVARVCQVPAADAGLQRAEVGPGLAGLQPRVRRALVHGEPLALLHLQQVVDQVDGCVRDDGRRIHPRYI